MNIKMKYHHIYIIGAGAVGKALAVSLKLEDKQVSLIRGSVNDGSRYEEKIGVLFKNKKELEADIEITTLSNFSEINGIVLLANKSYGNERLAHLLKEKIGNSPIVLLQNGLGVEQPFVDFGFPEIYRCVLFMTSQTISDTKVRYKPVSTSPIGIVKGSEPKLRAIVEQINSGTFPFKAESDIESIVWRKAIINCVFNSICPLLEVDNGVFHREEEVYAIAKRIVVECLAISEESGIQLNKNEILEDILNISHSSDGQFISTLQDINQGRETEIETLNLKIADIAESMSIEGSVTETRLLGELIRLKSQLNR